ncbi:MAG: hypothetical protein ACRDFC_08065 [Ignavibacteria bacterium]
MSYYHKELASGRWQTLTLAEQMANIGSEVHRAINRFKKKEKDSFQNAFERALELFDLTLNDSRWKGRRKEIARSREVFCTLLLDSGAFNNLEYELDSLNNYFFQFGIYASLHKERNKQRGYSS